MTPAEIQKESGKGKYKGIIRSEIFNLKIRAKAPFTLTNGSKVVGTKWDSIKRIFFVGAKQIPLSQKNDVKIYPPCPIYTRTTHSCVRMSAVTVTLRTFQQLHYIYAHGSTTKHTHIQAHTHIHAHTDIHTHTSNVI